MFSMAVVTSNIRDPSFSSYLSTNEQAMLRKLGDQRSPAKKKAAEEEEEIGVFGAEKYFKGAMDEDSSKSSSSTCSSMKFYAQKNQQNQRGNADQMKLKKHGTPSVRSEASSMNSQSALLKNSSIKPKRTNKAQRKKGFFAALSCCDKNAVDISDEHVGGIITATTLNVKQSLDLVSEALAKIKQGPDASWVKSEITVNKEKIEKLGAEEIRENCFTFPVSKPGSASNLHSKVPSFQAIDDEKVRKSIEVFGSPVMETRKKALGFEKRMSLMSWDAEFGAVKLGGNYANESDSDASSDLFEIESLTGKNNPFLARQAADGGATPTHGYAPSEASIEWSVATASAVDFSSAMSDCEDFVRPSPTNTKASRTSKEMVPIRHRSNALLGCKSHKSVKVAANAHRPQNHKAINDPQTMPRKPETPFMPSTRFQADTTNSNLTGFDSRLQRHQALMAPRPLPRAHSPHALFMQ